MNRTTLTIVFASVSLVATGCMTWSPGWEPRPLPATDAATSEILDTAKQRFASAGDADSLRSAIDSYQLVLDSDPSHLEALNGLAEASILYGAAYAQGKDEKAEWYRSGIRLTERAMGTNESFRNRVESGETIGEAVVALDRDAIRPMMLWVTGVSYYFKECLTGIGRLVYFRWMIRTREVMDRMLELDPEAQNGAVLFSNAIYYIGVPPGAGRDLDLSAEYLDRAIEVAPRSLLIRWGRAKYLHSRTDDEASRRSDLEWVLAQDPKTASSPFAWNVYFQRDSREMLNDLDR